MRPLFITAHYDDLEVCAGGTALMHGGISVVLYAKQTHGTELQASHAAAILGIETANPEPYIGDRNIVSWLGEIGEGCDTVIANSPYDSHPEHQAAAAIARQVARKHKGLWFMDHTIPGGYGNGPRPNHFVRFAQYRQTKYDAISCYPIISERELSTVMARDAYYGGIHGVGLAEGFVVEHSIQ